MKEKILFIVNPISGHHDKSKFPSMVDELIDKDKYEYTITLTEYAGHATELTKKAIEDQYDIIVAVGGDGTINEVATNMIGARQTFAIVPYGSGNGLARHMHLPLKPKKVITEVINKGVKSKIDTATMNGVPYISIAGVGFDAIIQSVILSLNQRNTTLYSTTRKNSIVSLFSSRLPTAISSAQMR